MGERWVPMPGFESDYHLSDAGRVRRISSGRGGVPGRILSAPPDGRGYPRLKLRDRASGARVDVKVHRLVAAAFIGPCPAGLDVNHINGVKTDNRAANLEYVTRSENLLHAWRVTKAARCTAATAAKRETTRREAGLGRKVSAEQVRAIRARIAAGEARERVASAYGITPSNVTAIARRKTWRHV